MTKNHEPDVKPDVKPARPAPVPASRVVLESAAHVAPSIGRIVIYRESDYEVSAEGGGTNPDGTNGTREHAAVITRVWSDACVNLAVFLDANGTRTKTSVMHEGVHQAGGVACWFWPPHV